MHDISGDVGLHESRKSVPPPGTRPSLARCAPLPIRLLVGYGLMAHGIAKLSRGPEAFAAVLRSIGAPAPHVTAWITILTELLGGFAVMIGAFVSLVSVPLAITLLTAIFTVHLRYGFSSIRLVAVTPAGAQFGPVGYECALLYLGCLATLVLAGPGPFAIDTALRNRKSLRPD